MANIIDLNDKLVYFVITGASKGIGATIAIETSKKFKSGSVVVLLARSKEGLEATKAAILEFNDQLKVFVKSIDLTKPTAEELNSILNESFDASVSYDMALVIHNVGTVGDVSKLAKEVEDYSELENYFSTNVFAPIVLNTQLMKMIPFNTQKVIVNITSATAVNAFKSFAFYCSGKAARQMYFKVLAEEEKNNNVLVLNYAPGPVETDMVADVQNRSSDNDLVSYFKGIRDDKTILTTGQTTIRLLNLIAKGNYETGAHVDYYDDI
ncbi:unnamed protein product [Diamesa serratosioi]